MEITCQKCMISCMREDEIIDGKCKYCNSELFIVGPRGEVNSRMKFRQSITESKEKRPLKGETMTIQIKQKGDTHYLLIDGHIIAFGSLLELSRLLHKPLKIKRGIK